MADGENRIFRTRSLERLSTPDRLDQLLRVVKRRNWIPLLAIGVLLLSGIAWCFLGRVPITADAAAVLVHPKQVVSIEARSEGTVRKVPVHVGDAVRAGQVLAELALPGLDAQLAAERSRLTTFEKRSAELAGFNREQSALETKRLEEQEARLAARIAKLRELAKEEGGRGEAYAQQIVNVRKVCEQNAALGAVLKARLDKLEAGRKEGDAEADERVLAAKERWLSNQLRCAELEAQVQDLRLRELGAQERHSASADLVADLEVQLERIRIDAHDRKRRLREAILVDETDAAGIAADIRRLEGLLESRGRIVAAHAGVVTDVTVSAGSRVVSGERIASIAVSDAGEALLALAYFDVAQGKQIEKGMRARVVPVAARQAQAGSLVAEVTRVSGYPVSTDAVLNQVGNREMAGMLLGGRSRIEVRVRLATEPDVRITSGTSARVTVTIEERAPITILIPALRGWLGLN